MCALLPPLPGIALLDHRKDNHSKDNAVSKDDTDSRTPDGGAPALLRSPERVWLLTGRPGVGKTTCLRRVLERLASLPAGGFFTEEIRERERRVGFALVTLSGERAILAHVQHRGEPHVGKYGVDVAALDRIGVPAIHDAVRRRALVVIDEIGRMEMTSAAFRLAVEAALASGVPVLGTILRPSHPWAETIKRHDAVRLIEVTPANRHAVPGDLADLIARQGAHGS